MIVLNWISLFSSLFLKNDFDQKENLTVQQIKSKTNIKNHLKKNDKVEILNLIDQKNNEQKYIDDQKIIELEKKIEQLNISNEKQKNYSHELKLLKEEERNYWNNTKVK